MHKLTKWSLTAALAGFLFGFDTVVISGADQKLQELWSSTDIFHGSVRSEEHTSELQSQD